METVLGRRSVRLIYATFHRSFAKTRSVIVSRTAIYKHTRKLRCFYTKQWR